MYLYIYIYIMRSRKEEKVSNKNNRPFACCKYNHVKIFKLNIDHYPYKTRLMKLLTDKKR